MAIVFSTPKISCDSAEAQISPDRKMENHETVEVLGVGTSFGLSATKSNDREQIAKYTALVISTNTLIGVGS